MASPRWAALPAVLRAAPAFRQLLAQHAPEGRFQRLRLPANVLLQGVIDPRLIVAAAVGVHLRWYLTNHIITRRISREVPRSKTVFVSVHADSLHPSVRGAMVYVPARSLRPDRYSPGLRSRRGAPLPQSFDLPRPLWEARSAGRLDLAARHNGRWADAAVVVACLMCLSQERSTKE